MVFYYGNLQINTLIIIDIGIITFSEAVKADTIEQQVRE